MAGWSEAAESGTPGGYAGARREVTFTLPELVTLLGEVARPTKPDSLAAAHEAIAAASSAEKRGGEAARTLRDCHGTTT